MTTTATHLDSAELYTLRGRVGPDRPIESLRWRYRLPELCEPKRRRPRLRLRRTRPDCGNR
jgi:hypothetical protein